jgi:hypothetical protein
MARLEPIVFLVDVDGTLLDNDGVQQDFEGSFGCARDPKMTGAFAPADITIERIGDLLDWLPQLRTASMHGSKVETVR